MSGPVPRHARKAREKILCRLRGDRDVERRTERRGLLLLGQGEGRISRYTARPARDSETCRMRRRFAEPAHRNRPGLRARSISSLMTESSFGARWISSIVIRSAPMSGASGSRTAVSRAASSSREVYLRDDPISGDFTSVVLPVCRAPTRMTTGDSFSTWASRTPCRRGRNACKSTTQRVIFHHYPFVKLSR